MSHQISNLSDSVSTCIKGAIGTAFPMAAFALNINSWASPIQVGFGMIIPMMTVANLYYILKRERRISREQDKEDRVREQRRLYFLRKHKRKHTNKNSLPTQELTDKIDS